MQHGTLINHCHSNDRHSNHNHAATVPIVRQTHASALGTNPCVCTRHPAPTSTGASNRSSGSMYSAHIPNMVILNTPCCTDLHRGLQSPHHGLEPFLHTSALGVLHITILGRWAPYIDREFLHTRTHISCTCAMAASHVCISKSSPETNPVPRSHTCHDASLYQILPY